MLNHEYIFLPAPRLTLWHKDSCEPIPLDDFEYVATMDFGAERRTVRLRFEGDAAEQDGHVLFAQDVTEHHGEGEWTLLEATGSFCAPRPWLEAWQAFAEKNVIVEAEGVDHGAAPQDKDDDGFEYDPRPHEVTFEEPKDAPLASGEGA